MVRDNARTVNVRLACLDILTKRNTPLVARDLWEMAVSRDDVEPELKVQAMTSLPQYNLLKGDMVRDALYKLIVQYDAAPASPPEPDEKRALRETFASTARASLLLSLQQAALEMP